MALLNNENLGPRVTMTFDKLDGIKILIVDDSLDNRRLLETYLGRHGATIDAAENGLVGFEKALRGNHDLVLMDVQMPEMDGFDTTSKLRSVGYRKPIIAITAQSRPDVRDKCLVVGCNEHMAKPVDFRELLAAVSKYTVM